MATKSSLTRSRGKSPARAARASSRSRSRSRGAVRFSKPKAYKGGKGPKKKGPGAAQQQLQLSECATDYAQCLLNPCGGVPSCLPSVGACTSRKVKYFARGSFSTQTSNGFGCIGFAPGVGVTNDSPCGFVSSAAGTGSAFNSAGTGMNVVVTNSDYPTATFGVGKQSYRLVSACVRIRYVGTVLNKAGSIYSLMEPDHQSLNSAGTGIPQLRAYNSCSDTPVTSEWTEVIYGGPTQPNEMDYITGVSQTEAAYNQQFMAMLISSPAGAALPFDYEYWANYEVIGPNVGGKTPSMADPTGLSVVANGAQSAIANGSGHHGGNDFLNKAVSGIGHAAKTAMTYIGPAWKAAGGIEGITKKLMPMITKRALPMIAMAAL